MEYGNEESNPCYLKVNNSRVVIIGNVISDMVSSNTTGAVSAIKLYGKDPEQWNSLIFICDFTWIIRDFETRVDVFHKFDFLGNRVSPLGVAILFVKCISLVDRSGDLDTKLILNCFSSTPFVEVALLQESLPFLPIV